MNSFKIEDYIGLKHCGADVFEVTLLEAEIQLDNVISLCPNRNVCIQAGGSFGIFPIHLSKSFKKVITFEPTPKTFKNLKENTKKLPNIEAYQCALGAHKGTGSLIECVDNSGANIIECNKPEGSIEINTIDLILKKHSHCDLIYLDIEGAEYKAILGAKKTIMKHRPVIVLENKGLSEEFTYEFFKEETTIGIYTQNQKDVFFMPEGSQEFRQFICKEFNYHFVKRILRDDIFLPN